MIKNPYNLNPDDIYTMGKRVDNPNRDFLFISKLLGKHLPVKPETVKATGYLLASLKYPFNPMLSIHTIFDDAAPNYKLQAFPTDTPPLVIGFCETATALGLAVASAIDGSVYIHTTREPVKKVLPLLTFEEEHSHATTHTLYSDFVEIDKFKEVILVDDEISTGHSLLNIITNLRANSNIREYSILTIMDNRSKEDIQRYYHYAATYGIHIHVYSLYADDEILSHTQKPTVILHNQDSTPITATNPIPPLALNLFPRYKNGELYLKHTGRFGMHYQDIKQLEKLAQSAANKIRPHLAYEHKILVLGHGETMYIPSRIAAYLQSESLDVDFRTTTRSPIYCDGVIIKDEVIYTDPHTQATYHLYNQEDTLHYDLVLLLTEFPLNLALCPHMLEFVL
jgi:adenine/guanine phosphoribosyltransferase-like PRPP-binding protein